MDFDDDEEPRVPIEAILKEAERSVDLVSFSEVLAKRNVLKQELE